MPPQKKKRPQCVTDSLSSVGYRHRRVHKRKQGKKMNVYSAALKHGRTVDTEVNRFVNGGMTASMFCTLGAEARAVIIALRRSRLEPVKAQVHVKTETNVPAIIDVVAKDEKGKFVVVEIKAPSSPATSYMKSYKQWIGKKKGSENPPKTICYLERPMFNSTYTHHYIQAHTGQRGLKHTHKLNYLPEGIVLIVFKGGQQVKMLKSSNFK